MLQNLQAAKQEEAIRVEELNEKKEKVAKLDRWLDNISSELKASVVHTDSFTEEDLIKYIEIYERYIREYEEYNILWQSVTVISDDVSSHSFKEKLSSTQKALEETKSLVTLEIERLKQILNQMKTAAEQVDDDISQTDRTLDSESMPEEIATTHVPQSEVSLHLDPTIKSNLQPELPIETHIKPNVTTETQTGQSLIEDHPAVVDKSITCELNKENTKEVCVTCAPPSDMQIQTDGSPDLKGQDILQNIQIKQTVSEGHETIEIASRPVVTKNNPAENIDLQIDADYRDGHETKDSQLNITHSYPQSFETIMVEPDETTTEVVVDADGSKRIIVKKVRRTLKTRQQTIQTQPGELDAESIPKEQSFSRIVLREDKGSTSTTLGDGEMRNVQYQTYGGQIVTGMQGGEVSIQEFTSRPEMIVEMDESMKPEEILQLADAERHSQIHTSSSSVTAVVQQVTRRIVRTQRRIIRRIVIIDGKEHVTEEIIDEPSVEEYNEQIPRVSISVKNNSNVLIEEVDDQPPDDQNDTDNLKERENQSQPQSKEGSPKDYYDDIPKKDGTEKQYSDTTLDQAESLPQQRQVPLEVIYEPAHISKQVMTTDMPDAQSGQYNIQSSNHTNIDLTSSVIATSMQKVTRKIIKSKRRIVKHIKIIDGKEHVTEEVIEEPDEVEIIEDELPISSELLHSDNIKIHESDSKFSDFKTKPDVNISQEFLENEVKHASKHVTDENVILIQTGLKRTSNLSDITEERLLQSEHTSQKQENTFSTENVYKNKSAPLGSETNITTIVDTGETKTPDVKTLIQEQPNLEKTSTQLETPANQLIEASESQNLELSATGELLTKTHDSETAFEEIEAENPSNITELVTDKTVFEQSIKDAYSTGISVPNVVDITQELLKSEAIETTLIEETDKNEQYNPLETLPVTSRIELTDPHPETIAKEIETELKSDITIVEKTHICEPDAVMLKTLPALSSCDSKELTETVDKTIDTETIKDIKFEDINVPYSSNDAYTQPIDVPSIIDITQQLLTTEAVNRTIIEEPDKPKPIDSALETLSGKFESTEVHTKTIVKKIDTKLEKDEIRTDKKEALLENIDQSKKSQLVEDTTEKKDEKNSEKLTDIVNDVISAAPIDDISNYASKELSEKFESDNILIHSGTPDISYIQQFQNEDIPRQQQDISTHEITSQPVIEEFASNIQTQVNINQFLQSERQNTSLGLLIADSIPQLIKGADDRKNVLHTIDISTSLRKSEKHKDFAVEPSLECNLTVEDHNAQGATLVKKDVDVALPSEVKIISDPIESNVTDIIEENLSSNTAHEVTTKKKKRNRKNRKGDLESQSSETTTSENVESLAETASSPLDHYIEISDTSKLDSPQPTDINLVGDTFTTQLDSPIIDSESITEEVGYEPEDLSTENVSRSEPKKSKKKKKNKLPSEETIYPITSTAESDGTSRSTPVQVVETTTKKHRKKKNNKETIEKDVTHVEEVQPKIGDEIVHSSPKDESYHTISETSDVSTVKIIEECVQSDLEKLDKESVSATITYPVSVVEEIPTYEHSVQTSPDVSIHMKVESNIETEISKPESVHISLQTTPIPLSESLVQTTPVEDQEMFTQTTDDLVTCVEEKVTLDSEMQTTREPSPTQIDVSEATTQVNVNEILLPEEKFSQTSSPIIETSEVLEEKPTALLETREMQTSPLPIIKQDEKETETTVESLEQNIQTVHPEIVSIGTSTLPIPEKEYTTIGVQVPKLASADICTQSDELLENRDILVTDVSNKIQASTVDSVQQTTPRDISDDSISTSTDDPYEVHLRAQISIPHSTTANFIETERQHSDMRPQALHTEKSKNKRSKKFKRKLDDAYQTISPESLSDPLTTELSLSASSPTSDDLSTKESSIDEGISQKSQTSSISYVENNQPKLTYSDVVQRSKSKSPSPCKSLIPVQSGPLKLINIVENRIQTAQDRHQSKLTCPVSLSLIEPSIHESYDLILNNQLKDVKVAIKNKDKCLVEKNITIIIETISIWLEEVQYNIYQEQVMGMVPTSQDETLRSIQNSIASLKEILEITEINEETIILLETITKQILAVKSVNEESSTKMKEVGKEWNEFVNNVQNVNNSVEKVKTKFDQLVNSDEPTQYKLEKLDKIEIDNIKNCEQISKHFKLYRNLVAQNSQRQCPESLYVSDEETKQIENCINTERDRLLQLSALVEEYEQTLQDFGQITDVAEALLDGKIIVTDLSHLHEEIQKHRKFFVNLSHCRAILESLEDNLDSDTKAKYSSLHNSLHDKATSIIDRAANRAQQMTLAASRWTTLEQGMKEEQQWLGVAQQRIPDLSNVTSIDHDQYVNLYQSISVDVSHHHAKILRLLAITESLQNLISCNGLEYRCSSALDTILKLQEDIDTRMTRLVAFRENWITYDRLVDRIEDWVKTANRELLQITPETITSTANLRRFWELKAQHEVHNNIKNESGVQFSKALEILSISDEMVQRQFFSKLEDQWRDLSHRMEEVHRTAIQNISDRGVPSDEKLGILDEEIKELRVSFEGLKGVIKNRDELNLYIERLQVMSNRIDGIQNELGRLSLLPGAESDRLRPLLEESRVLDEQIVEELERSLLLREKILQIESGISRYHKNQNRVRLSLEECGVAERLGSDVVEKASNTCERLLHELSGQWHDILALRQALHTLPLSLRVCVSPTGIERDISELQVSTLNVH